MLLPVVVDDRQAVTVGGTAIGDENDRTVAGSILSINIIIAGTNNGMVLNDDRCAIFVRRRRRRRRQRVVSAAMLRSSSFISRVDVGRENPSYRSSYSMSPSFCST